MTADLYSNILVFTRLIQTAVRFLVWMYLMNLSALLMDVFIEMHEDILVVMYSSSSPLILPHCQAGQRRRLQRHHIWLWGHDPLPGQAPTDRLPEPSAAWSGSRSLRTQEMTARRRWMRWESAGPQAPASFLDIVQRKTKKGVWAWMKNVVTVSERRRRRARAPQIYWGPKNKP